MPDIFALMRAIRRSALSAPERHTLLTLTTLVDPKTGLIPDRFQPSLTDLTRFTGLGRSTVVRSLNVAETGGWIKRTVPTKKAAQTQKEKTSYLLAIPDGALGEDDEDPAGASATVGLVPERDQPEGWCQCGPSAAVALGLVPQRDGASATVGHKNCSMCTSMNQPPPSEGDTRDEATTTDTLFSVPGQRHPRNDEASTAPPGRPAKRKRLSRVITKDPEPLPEDWSVSAEMIEWAKVETPNVGRFATDKFIEHFRDGSVGKRRKKDWDGTWRNWMRTDQERFEERNGFRGDQPVNKPGTSVTRVDDNGRRGGELDRSHIRSPADQRIADAQPLYEKYKRQEMEKNARG